MESFLEILEERNVCPNKISGQKKEQRDMERINDLLEKRGDCSKIVMSQHHQQNADASCNIKVPDPFGHEDVS